MYIGDIEVTPVYDGRFLFAMPDGFPQSGEPDFVAHHVKRHTDGRWIMDIGAFVVRTGDRVLLIDAGAGPGDMCPICPKPFNSIDDADEALIAYFRDRGLSGEMLARTVAGQSQTEVRHGLLGAELRRAGFTPDDITDVVLSHLHFDHIGWVSDQGKPYFPNATYRCERHDFDYFLGPQPHDERYYNIVWKAKSARERMAPVLDRTELWDRDSNIAPGVDAMFAPGHTPGSSVIVLSSRDQRALIVGDTLHCPLELTDPEFSLMADVDQALADRTRAAIARELEGKPVLASAPHFPDLKFGRLLPGEGKRGWSFV